MSEHSSKHEFVPSNREDGYCSFWNGRAFCNNCPSHPIHAHAEPKPVEIADKCYICTGEPISEDGRCFVCKAEERTSADAYNLRSSVHAICNANLTEALAAALEQKFRADGLEAQLSQAQQRIASLETELSARRT